MAQRWVSPNQQRRLARIPEDKREKLSQGIASLYGRSSDDAYRPDLYQYGGDSLLGAVLPIKRRIIKPESQSAEFTGYDDRGRPMYEVTTTPAELGPVERGPSLGTRLFGAAKDLYNQATENPMGIVGGIDNYLRGQVQAAGAGGRTWNPETQQLTEFDPAGIPGMAMGTGYALSTPIEGAVAGMAVKQKGGNWLSLDESLSYFKRAFDPYQDTIPEDVGEEFFKHYDANNYHGQSDPDLLYDLTDFVHATYGKEAFIPPQEAALNRWIDQKLGKYIRNELATPEDPLRELADRDITHTQNLLYEFGDSDILPEVEANRKLAGLPLEGFAKTPLGRAWENAADTIVGVDRASNIQQGRSYDSNTEFWVNPDDYPWAKKLLPDTPVYTAGRLGLAHGLQFRHLVDEMRNAVSPDTTLPERLRIDPNKLDRMSVPQMVERVSNINRWRADEAARAERAGMLANLQAAPRLDAPDLDLNFTEKPGGKWVDIPDTREDGLPVCTSIGKAGGWCTMEEATATEYGSGVNRLTALLDAEGRPHVQAMIGIADNYGSRRAYEKPVIRELKPPGNEFGSDRARTYAKRDPAYREKITQQVLKFLNEGDWGDVNDLRHYDIVDTKKRMGRGTNFNYSGPRFVTEDQWNAITRSHNSPSNNKNLATGGPVTMPSNYSKGRWRLI